MQQRRLVPTLAGLVIVTALMMLRVADPYPVQLAREIGFDLYQRMAPREGPPQPVRVVDIDEASLTDLGQWPWPRDLLATLTDRLAELGAAVVAYDVLFAEPDRMSPKRLGAGVSGVDPASLPDYDELFATSLRNLPSALGFSSAPSAPPLTGDAKPGFSVLGQDPRASIPALTGAVVPLPLLRDAAAGFGSLSLDVEELGGTVRQVPLIWRSGTTLYPTLSIEALRLAMGVDTLLVLGENKAAGYMAGMRVGPLSIPTTSSGALRLYYARPDAQLAVSARDILGPDYRSKAPLIAGQIVLVGTSASGLLDLHNTILGDRVPGVFIHAEAIQQIMSGAFLSRADWLSGLELAALALSGLLLVLVVLRLGPLAGLLLAAVLIGGMLSTSWLLFRQQGMLVDASYPAVSALLVYGAMVYFQFSISDSNRKELRRAFGYYVAPQLLSQIERNAAALRLGGELRQITVMFADMRDFTSFSENLAPEQVVTTLNVLFGALGKEIVDRYGTIDKFIGDSIMAFWNAPLDVAEHPSLAVAAALAMRQRLAALNAADAFGLGAAGGSIALGIGLSTGDALVGNMGLETRFDYSSVGDSVNVAARVESASKSIGYDIVASDATRHATSGFAWLAAGAVSLKGKRARVPIHILVGDETMRQSAAFVALAAAHEELILELASGGMSSETFELCRRAGTDLQPELGGFYELLAERIQDFVV